MVDHGELGTISGAYARTSHGGPELYYARVREAFSEKEDPSDALWFFDTRRASVGALFDMGVYAIANLVAVLGGVKSVFGPALTLYKPTELEDTASLMLEFERGLVGVAETSWCDPAHTWILHVHGTEGKLLAGLPGEPLQHVTPTSTASEEAPLEIEEVDLSQTKVG